MKLSEFIGKGKCRLPGWDTGAFNSPAFKDRRGDVYGVDELGDGFRYPDRRDDWEPYTEPEKTQTVYEWMLPDSHGDWFVSDALRTEKQVEMEFAADKCRKTGREFQVPVKS